MSVTAPKAPTRDAARATATSHLVERNSSPVLAWLRGFCATWGLATVVVLGMSLLGQLSAERDWIGRTLVLLLLGGQVCLAGLQIAHWRGRSKRAKADLSV